MKEIELTQGMVALVDDEDFERLNAVKWCVHKGKRTFYAVRHLSRAMGHGLIQMHNVVAGDPPPGLERDHRDGNGLNNQKENLRLCTTQQNQMNASPRRGAECFR